MIEDALKYIIVRFGSVQWLRDGTSLYTNVINYKFGMLIIISSRNLSIEL